MRKQTGCIYVNGDNWCLRWREGENGARAQLLREGKSYSEAMDIVLEQEAS